MDGRGAARWGNLTLGGVNATGNATRRWGRFSNMTREEYLAYREHEEKEMKHALLTFYLVLFCLFFAQSGLVLWRKRHRRSYELVTLLGLWLIPPIICLHVGYYRFIAVWLVYSGVTLYYLWACTFHQLDKKLPRQIYRWFTFTFRASVALGVAGYGLLLAEIFGLGLLLRPLLSPAAALVAVWYGLYYGILSRDCAEVASDRIASMMGSGRKMAVSVRSCGICSGDLPDTVGGPQPAAPDGRPQEKSVQLSCKHLFHEDCIRGWTIVGKKDTCPTCWEKVDLRSTFADRPWETSNLSWIQMLDMIRYLVVWNPIILTVVHFAFHAAGIEHGEDAAAAAASGNGTALANATTAANATAGAAAAVLRRVFL